MMAILATTSSIDSLLHERHLGLVGQARIYMYTYMFYFMHVAPRRSAGTFAERGAMRTLERGICISSM